MNNQITRLQWNELMEAVISHSQNANQPMDVLYSGARKFGDAKRYFCYDNYDRHHIPGLDFVISNNAEQGKLTVYNSSEQARAPIDFEEGMRIAKNFFNEKGSDMAEEIVCDWVMSGNASTF